MYIRHARVHCQQQVQTLHVMRARVSTETSLTGVLDPAFHASTYAGDLTSLMALLLQKVQQCSSVLQ